MFCRSPLIFSRCQARTVATFATFTPRFDDRCTARLQHPARAMYLIVVTCFDIDHLTRETCITIFRNVFQLVVTSFTTACLHGSRKVGMHVALFVSLFVTATYLALCMPVKTDTRGYTSRRRRGKEKDVARPRQINFARIFNNGSECNLRRDGGRGLEGCERFANKRGGGHLK